MAYENQVSLFDPENLFGDEGPNRSSVTGSLASSEAADTAEFAGAVTEASLGRGAKKHEPLYVPIPLHRTVTIENRPSAEESRKGAEKSTERSRQFALAGVDFGGLQRSLAHLQAETERLQAARVAQAVAAREALAKEMRRLDDEDAMAVILMAA